MEGICFPFHPGARCNSSFSASILCRPFDGKRHHLKIRIALRKSSHGFCGKFKSSAFSHCADRPKFGLFALQCRRGCTRLTSELWPKSQVRHKNEELHQHQSRGQMLANNSTKGKVSLELLMNARHRATQLCRLVSQTRAPVQQRPTPLRNQDARSSRLRDSLVSCTDTHTRTHKHTHKQQTKTRTNRTHTHT